MDDEDADGCTVESAAVAMRYGGADRSLFCSCGFVAKGDTWEEAGCAMDDHLEKTTP